MEEIKMTKLIKTLLNGTKHYALEVENDWTEAEKIWYTSRKLENLSEPQIAYNEREQLSSLGTYEIIIERKADYNNFTRLLNTEKLQKISDIREEIYELYRKGFYTREEYHNFYYSDIDQYMKNKKDKLFTFRLPTIEEWTSGKYQESEKRSLRLGKALLKAGFNQSTVDYYSQQIKTEKTIYITISDRVHHILGMSNYVDLENLRFDGFQGSSCQDTRHGYSEIDKLAGSLYDENLYIAMMHYSLDDVNNMNNKLAGRTILRQAELEGRELLLATEYYGNNVTKNELHEGLKKLHENGIFERTDGRDTITIPFGGYFNASAEISAWYCIEESYEIEADCPVCDSDNEYAVYDENDNRHYITCPVCNGSGTIELPFEVSMEDSVEIEVDDCEIAPYVEGYWITSYNSAKMNVDVFYIVEEIMDIKDALLNKQSRQLELEI